ncbi:pentatricopeptide repeat-containing protein At1g62680, mitochondrial-like [Pistacia vera]|uniref:pentatricopeptide repeat-containing protein At1g62680, mitochondrial-like n=1 Tax=Pistacia vera TaxID=55513 RepID=UPI00126336EB|nr:pentatricopeptide repeat-containing protein At1g62680, mitochondrial-like [Pistacia vera]
MTDEQSPAKRQKNTAQNQNKVHGKEKRRAQNLAKGNEVEEAKTKFEEIQMTSTSKTPLLEEPKDTLTSGLAYVDFADDAHLAAVVRKNKQSFLEEGALPNVITCNTLIGGLCKTKKVSVAIKLLEEVVNGNKESGVICRPNVVTYSIMMNKEVNEALSLYREMISEGIRPDVITYNTLLTGFFLIEKVKDARNLVGEMRLNDTFPDSWTYNIFVNGLCKNGYVLEAVEMFNALVNNKVAVNIEGLNSLIDGLCKIERFETA